MSLSLLQTEMARISVRTHRTMVVSMLVHAMVFMCLLWFQSQQPVSTLVTEITWIDADEIEVAPEPLPEVRQEKKSLPPKPVERSERFRRETEVAEIAPDPQIDVVRDRLREKLAKLPKMDTSRILRAASANPTAMILSQAMPAAPKTQRGNTALQLKRDTRPTAPALELKRAEVSSQPSRLARVAAPAIDPRRALGGTVESSGPSHGTVSGPAADRTLLSRILPRYPEWAKREGVEASVSLYFIVLADGGVKANILVQKTSGFDDFDREARQALLAWRFEPLIGLDAAEQWGSITINFRLTK